MVSLLVACAALAPSGCGPPATAGADPAPAAPALHPVGVKLTLTFEDDVADEALLARWQDLFSEASAVLWRASEGRVFLGRCTIAERAGWGEIVVPHGALDRSVTASGAAFEVREAGSERWRVLAAGRPMEREDGDDEEAALLLAAAIARGVYGLDEHRAADAGQGCLLADGAERLCADGEPELARRACRSVIDERWQGLAGFADGSDAWNGDEPPPRTAFERLRESP